MTTKTDTLPATITEPAAPALISPDDEWADVGDGDLSPATAASIPLLALNRKESGGFVDSETGVKEIELDFVWLAKGTTRAWWPEPFGKGDKAPSCRSADGLVPDPASPEVQNPTCASCPRSRWVGEDSPECKQSIEAMVFLPDPLGYGRLARVRFGGMAIKPAQDYWDSFSARMPRRPPLAYISHVALEPTETPNGTFLVPHFSRVRPLSRAEAQPLIDERDRRIAEWSAAVADDVATGATRDAEQPAGAPSGAAGTPTEPYYTDDDGEPF